VKVEPLKRKKIHTGWQKPIRHSPTSEYNLNLINRFASHSFQEWLFLFDGFYTC
jgi:hypothetical protein